MTHVARIEKIEDECRGVWGQSGVTSWERERKVFGSCEN